MELTFKIKRSSGREGIRRNVGLCGLEAEIKVLKHI